MTPFEVREGMKLLRNYYTKEGQPWPLNDAQWGVYIAGLVRYAPADLERAAHQWMQTSKFFPALSDLRSLILASVSASTREQRELAEDQARHRLASGDRPVDPAKLANFKRDVAAYLESHRMKGGR